ncbi:hypothetical protein OSC27_09755 [Microbacterium sp. STN6]|uniref:hypothetical protein n=1 Tax=Microbacterium sp. STN6 TaxID=2995588 RepID=UPI002260C51F|nr:hypothetical protein [Microbacterium sp. STN6]MCX7522557.1 hypothetical protein [Microbacterium sp. STN6]
MTITIGALRPGVSPQQVLPAATDAAAELTTAEASNVAVVRGEARLTVRFAADDDELAAQIAQHVVETTATLAEPAAWQITRRSQNRWLTLKRA